jgi:thiaminase
MMKTLDTCVGQLGDALRAFPWQKREPYADWLTQTYYYVRHSTRLLAASAARFAQDPTGDALHHRFARHMSEEKKHERLALHDLDQLGFRKDALVERNSTRMFYECQYYKVEHVDPAALFGYILALEVMSATHGPWVFETVSSAFGPSAASFLKLHAHEDEKHTREALAMLDRLPEDSRLVIEKNLEQTTFGYLTILRDVAGP